jgi:DNA-directed RNA polymerase subunit alpha
MNQSLFRLTGVLHPAAIGDGFVIPLFESEDDRDQATYVQRCQRDLITGFDEVDLDDDDVVISTNSQRHMAVGDRPLRAFKSRSIGLLIGNVFYLRSALEGIRTDYPEGSGNRKLIEAFFTEQPDATSEIGTATPNIAPASILESSIEAETPPRVAPPFYTLKDLRATFVTEPLDRGFGLTLGNALRRVLLSAIKGWAITAIRIDDVLHEFSTLAGMREDVVELALNVKQIAIGVSDDQPRSFRLDVVGPRKVKAGDIKPTVGVEILNPELVLCHLDPGAKLGIEFWASVGKGYLSAASNRPDDAQVGLLPIDALFSPVRQVSYQVENTLTGDEFDSDKLIMTIVTDGSLMPSEALSEAAQILRSHLNLYISSPTTALESSEKLGWLKASVSSRPTNHRQDDKNAPPNRFMLKKIEEIELSVRLATCLRNDNIIYIGDLVQKTEAEMLRTPNFGRKSLSEIKEVLASMGLRLGMTIPVWPPENIERLETLSTWERA